MSTNRYIQLLQLLVEQTDSGKLDWKDTGEESKFFVAFPNYSILISEEPGESVLFPEYYISVVNSEGRIVDRFSAATLPSEILGKNSYNVMRDLFSQARRSALRVDEALDNIIAHLGGAAGH
jgi:hypothetical protein